MPDLLLTCLNQDSTSLAAMAPSSRFPNSSSDELRVPEEQTTFVRTLANNSPRLPIEGRSLLPWEASLKCSIPSLALTDPLIRRTPGSAGSSPLSFQSSYHSIKNSSKHICSSSDSVGNAVMREEWQQMLLSTSGYGSAMASILCSSSISTTNTPNTVADLLPGKPGTWEPIMGSFGGVLLADEALPLRPSPVLSPNQHQVRLSLEKVQCVGSSWNSSEALSKSRITKNPSQEGVVLQADSQVSVHNVQQLDCESVIQEALTTLPSYCSGDTNQLTHAFRIASGCSALQSSVPSNLSMCVHVPKQIAVSRGGGAKSPDCPERFGEAKVIDVDKSVRKEGSSAPLELDRADFLCTVNYEPDEIGSNPPEENSLGSEQANEGNGASSVAKRKNLLKAKFKDMSYVPTSLKDNYRKVTMDISASKRQKGVETEKEKEENKYVAEESGSENSENSTPGSANENNKLPEAPKANYIHIRARRGQATDSHSLAERARREKISKRMKFLQDLVPGCNKVTGKAVMLDQIINYVQSLQHQVEFLSMKLGAAVNSRLDFSVNSLLNKEGPDLFQNLAAETQPAHIYSQIYQQKQTQLQAILRGRGPGIRSLSDVPVASSKEEISLLSPPSELYGDLVCQRKNILDGDLQSIVQMGCNQNRQYFLESQELHNICRMPSESWFS
ncbi:hypothetical protein O6H91_18G022900 [Diphasiastrum complanatum]|uniref:Uncharacterized protein n=1 Tax=Diphasiastrum complanatum TaxID=34168 RepID=A0ACC2AYX7_DIPCM|nr:hypothetical protein O6H91_18G022900 [Diphasiastrum complanatum]